MNPILSSRDVMSSSMVSVCDILHRVQSFIRSIGQRPSSAADRSIEDVRYILDSAAEWYSAGCVIAYLKGHVADIACEGRLLYRELRN